MRCDPAELERDLDEKLPALDLPEGVPPLNSFYLYLTTGCNLACRHCWITPEFVQGEPSPGDCLDVDLLRQAVAEAKPLGLSHAKLTGGEPTLHPRFVEIVDLLTAEGLGLDMETNGTLIDAPLARHLRQLTNVSFISVSLDGATAETHDAFRNVDGAYEAALLGLGHLVAAGYRNVQVIMSPHHGNLAELEDLVRLAVERGAGSVKFNPVTRSGRGVAMHERGEALDFEEVIGLVRHVRGPLQDRTPIPLHLMIPPAVSTVGELLRTQDGGGACQVRHVLGILGTGHMALCGIGRNVRELCFGRLGEAGIREVWLGHPVLRELREDLAEPAEYPGICGECLHAARCLTYCVAQNFLDGGHLVWPADLCVKAEQRGAFPASRKRTTQIEVREMAYELV
jgi:SynChlorMet cassette radical SAM/SPASM protein ScmF